MLPPRYTIELLTNSWTRCLNMKLSPITKKNYVWTLYSNLTSNFYSLNFIFVWYIQFYTTFCIGRRRLVKRSSDKTDRLDQGHEKSGKTIVWRYQLEYWDLTLSWSKFEPFLWRYKGPILEVSVDLTPRWLRGLSGTRVCIVDCST